VLGGTVGARLRLGLLELDSGLFAGGGGGASAPQGSGLMLRPYVGLAFRLGPVSPRLELAHVTFPTGHISTTGLAVGASLEGALAFLRAANEALAPDAAAVERGLRRGIGVNAVTYLPWSGARLRSGGP
jgi:hypothetical protein